jgi:hypothetical protein
VGLVLKFIGWLSKLIIGTMLIVFISVITTWSMVNIYMQALLNDMNISVEHEVSLGDVLVIAAEQIEHWIEPGSSNIKLAIEPGEVDFNGETHGETHNTEPGDAESSDESQAEVNHYDYYNDSFAEQSEALKQEKEDPFSEEAVEVWGQVKETETEADQRIVLSPDDFNQKKNQLTGEDKMKIFSLLMTKVPAAEIQKLSLYLEEGLTHEEIQEIMKIIRSYLQQDEVQQLVAILEKYE